MRAPREGKLQRVPGAEELYLHAQKKRQESLENRVHTNSNGCAAAEGASYKGEAD